MMARQGELVTEKIVTPTTDIVNPNRITFIQRAAAIRSTPIHPKNQAGVRNPGDAQ
jgi:hypothetical protein